MSKEKPVVKNLQKEIEEKKTKLAELKTQKEISKRSLQYATSEIASLQRDIDSLEIALSII